MNAWEWVETETFDAALSASLFFSVIVLAMLACRQPARRILIARVALLASLAIIPLSRVDVLPRLDLVKVLLSSDLVPRDFLTSSVSVRRDHYSPVSIAATSPSPTDRSSAVSVDRTHHGPWRWAADAVVLLVLSGIAAGFAFLLLGFGGVQWLIRRSHRPSAAAQMLHQQLITPGSRMARRSVLRVSNRVRRPVVVGFFHPTILIPDSLDLPSGNPESLRLSLLHELAHIERYDYGFNAVANLAQTVWFFLPHTWWLRSRLMIDQEFLADQSAARRYGPSSEYASALLGMAAHGSAAPRGEMAIPTPGALPFPSGKSPVPSPLFQRILMLLHCPFAIETRTPRLWSWSWNFGVFGALLLATCLVIRWPKAELLGSASNTGAAVTRFHVKYFVAEPLPGPANGRSVAYVMPLILPPLFDLDVEVSCTTPDGLDHIRIAGYPLCPGIPLSSSQDVIPAPPSSDAKSWRRIHLHRDHQNVTVEVDGQPVCEKPMPEATPERLTIEPGPEGPAEFRELTVTW